MTPAQSQLAATGAELLGHDNRGVFGLLKAAQTWRPGDAPFTAWARLLIRRDIIGDYRKECSCHALVHCDESCPEPACRESDPDTRMTLEELRSAAPEPMKFLDELYLRFHGVQKDMQRHRGIRSKCVVSMRRRAAIQQVRN